MKRKWKWKWKWKWVWGFLFCLVVGFTLINLARMTNGQHLFIPRTALAEYQVSIAGEQKEKAKLQGQIDELRVKLNEYTKLQTDRQQLIDQLTQSLQKERIYYGTMSGDLDLTGPGIKIIVDDGTRELQLGENPNDILVHDSDLRLILNELKASGAEAIALNGQRLTDLSSVNCSGYTVRINGQFFARPFIIEAIGDGSRMSAQLIGPTGFGTVLKSWGLRFKVTQEDNIRIAAYGEGRRYEYAQPVKPVTTGKGGINN